MSETTPETTTPQPALCCYCGKPAEGNYTIHRDVDAQGLPFGPELPLCDAHGGGELPTCEQIWKRIAVRRAKGELQ